jgi:hypothetical protein
MYVGRANSIALTYIDRVHLEAQLLLRARGDKIPINWYEFLHMTSLAASGIGAIDSRFRHVALGRARLFAWHVTPEVLPAVYSLGGVIYLCWGLPERGLLRDKIFEFVLNNARHVLVNDPVTMEEIYTATGRRAVMIPYFIDSNYYEFRGYLSRRDFLFCNGTNDRDVELLVGLAQRGHNIKWLVNDSSLFERFYGKYETLELCRKIEYTELRCLYQTCSLFLMPILGDRHCSGQTTCLEAVSCGAPVLVSQGRTAKILEGLQSVYVINSNDVNVWDIQIKKKREALLYDHGVLSLSRNNLISRLGTLELYGQYLSD